jgi:hypothetical protein
MYMIVNSGIKKLIDIPGKGERWSCNTYWLELLSYLLVLILHILIDIGTQIAARLHSQLEANTLPLQSAGSFLFIRLGIHT